MWISAHQYFQLLHNSMSLVISLSDLTLHCPWCKYNVLIMLQKLEKKHWQWLDLKSEQWIVFKRNIYEGYCSHPIICQMVLKNAHSTELGPVERKIFGCSVNPCVIHAGSIPVKFSDKVILYMGEHITILRGHHQDFFLFIWVGVFCTKDMSFSVYIETTLDML